MAKNELAIINGDGTLHNRTGAATDTRHPNKKDLPFNVKDYGAKGDGVTDDGPAFQAAINAAIDANPTNAVTGNTTAKPPAVLIPAGVYYIKTAVSKQLNPTTGWNADKRRLSLVGAANGSTTITFDVNTAPVAFEFYRGKVTLDNITFDGKGVYTGVMLSLGRPGSSQYIQQFQINRVDFSRIGAGGTMVRAVWMFDGTWTDCLFQNAKEGAVMIDMPSQAEDNNNNWAFRRCHFEEGLGATMIRARSQFGSMNYHTGFSFDCCHWETRSFNTRILDLEGCSRWTFISPQFTHSNAATGENNGVTAAQIVNALRFVNCNSFQFISGTCTRQNQATDWLRKPIALGGNVRAFEFRGMYFFLNTATGMSTAGKSQLWESDSAVPLSSVATQPISVVKCLINNFTYAETFDELQGWSDTTSTMVWTSRFDPVSKKLVYGYGGGITDVSSGRTDRFALGKDGGVGVGYLNGTSYTIPVGGTQVYNIAMDGNPNKRGVYIVSANDGSGSYAMVFNSGSSLDAISVGTAFAVGNTDPAVEGKYNLFLTAANLTVTNRRTNDRAVSVVPITINAIA